LPRALAEALGKEKYFAESLTAGSRQRWRRKWAVCGTEALPRFYLYREPVFAERPIFDSRQRGTPSAKLLCPEVVVFFVLAQYLLMPTRTEILLESLFNLGTKHSWTEKLESTLKSPKSCMYL
jgi:hypothetical protein